MSSIYREITTKTQVGFECGMCHKEYKTKKCDEDWPHSNKGFIFYDSGDDNPAIDMDFCDNCWLKLKGLVIAIGGKFD